MTPDRSDTSRDNEDETMVGMESATAAPMLAGPAGIRSTVYKQGDYHFEIDTPRGAPASCGAKIFIGVASGLVFGGPCVGIYFLLRAVVEGHLFGLAPLIPLSIYLLVGPRCLCGEAIDFRTQQNLVITATEFHIKRTIEFHSVSKDSINHPDRATEALTWRDRWFCRQESGKRSDLTEAEIVERENSGIISYALYLKAGGARHCLERNYSNQEREWLAARINSFLRNDRRESP